jgi:hypothetical protein
MKRSLLITAALALAFAAPAGAKGPDQATITGPGLDEAIVLGGDAEGNFTSTFGRFVHGAGFVSAVFQQTPDPMLRQRPKGDLGPRYDVVYRVPGGDAGTSTVRQVLYPYAPGGAVTYVRPGQLIFDGQHATHGGWFVSPDPAFAKLLVSLGLPDAAPRPAAVVKSEPEQRRASRWLPIAFAGLLLPAAVFAVLRKKR